MAELKKTCLAIIQGKEYQRNTTRKKVLYSKCLNVEKRMFDLYLKTGKCKESNFPFESMGNLLYTNKSEMEKIVKCFFDVGWKPEVHVMLTRKKFEKITFIGRSITY